jgi:hypothetical protein
VTRTTVELLRFAPQSKRTAEFFEALAQAAPGAGIDLMVTDTYRGTASWLLLWGPGAPDRLPPMRQQLASGGHVVCADLAYWSRDTKVRVSIDAPHPQAWVLRQDWPGTRWQQDPAPIADTWDPRGPVLVAGIGEKATVQYGDDLVRAWERSMLHMAQARGCEVRYRPKLLRGVVLDGIPRAGTGPIDPILQGCSRVITWHSNVAVDAIRMGIPVICRDGAAAAVCPSTWTDDASPLAVDVRDRFLTNLAWFQWSGSEAAACWAFLRELLA